jgi:hypothetical protein
VSTPTLTKPSWQAGPLQLVIGNRRFWFPVATHVVKTTVDRVQMGYALCPDGSLHAFTAQGEVIIPEPMRAAVTAKYFPPDP